MIAEEREMEAKGEERRMKIEADKEIELAWIAFQATPAQACLETAMSRQSLSQYKDGKDITMYLTRFKRVAALLWVDGAT